MDGVVNLNKPAGVSSAKYAYKLRPIIGIRKVGHAGTLDPFADGVLVVCCGKGTKLVEQLMGLPKVYRTTLELGVTSASFDPEQPVESVPVDAPPPMDRVQEVVQTWVGDVQQTPPMFSAIKVGGRRAYKLAVKGQSPIIQPRTVRIDTIEIVRYEWPHLELVIHCGRGTYIRSLARDIGKALATGAICRTLTREAVGPFTLDTAVQIATDSDQTVRDAVISPEQARTMLPANPPS